MLYDYVHAYRVILEMRRVGGEVGSQGELRATAPSFVLGMRSGLRVPTTLEETFPPLGFRALQRRMP